MRLLRPVQRGADRLGINRPELIGHPIAEDRVAGKIDARETSVGRGDEINEGSGKSQFGCVKTDRAFILILAADETIIACPDIQDGVPIDGVNVIYYGLPGIE